MSKKLSEHFSLFELTSTDCKELQAKNRELTIDQIAKLALVADLAEQVRALLACMLHVHSGYRCPDLNKAVGSSSRSQHMLCEALDFDRYGAHYTEATLQQDFATIVAAAKAGKFKFGQLIMESAKRYTKAGQEVSMWLHISLGAPWRPAERSGQLLSMKDGIYISKGTI